MLVQNAVSTLYNPLARAGGPILRGAAAASRRDDPPADDRDLDDPLPAISRPGTNAVVDEMSDHNLELPPNASRTFGHHRVIVHYFTPDGNWSDIGTAVAADQLSGMTPSQQAEFMQRTNAQPGEIRPGNAALMQLPPTKDFDKMVAPRPDITYREIDYTRIGQIPLDDPKSLVIHYTAAVDDTPDSVWKMFNDGQGIPSSHFIVGKDGAILQILPQNQMCDGTLDFNEHSLQIEVCGNFRLEKETDAEFNSTLALVRHLQKQYQIPDTQIISHRQVDNNFGHVGRKPDPTFHFMNRLYAALQAAEQPPAEPAPPPQR